ncbi:helix-turn-helix domain-containing protein [Enterococcus alcedinis]|uniref:AraC family transcriptional regulator n=1 Tax=Enterococcus alcedinis TaxID=1274384 RepID=A0A917N5G3_9ENTE|nr:AraC family transcriptional regulator [Enterococcus alcedinis]MBP2103149.1 AraC-like DNA-binding protein [Enterococcus alcedinis]GGI66710.1 AraC family transcriptional regulator [Enterococcus alcedinis]
MHYELNRFGSDNYWEYARHTNFSYAPHFHRSLEFIYLEYGKLTIIQANTVTQLEAGESLLFLPNEIHGYESNGGSLFHSLVFSPDFVSSFINKVAGKRAVNATFVLRDICFADESVISKLFTNEFSLRGLLFIICGNFYDQADWVPEGNQKTNLLYQIIDYIGRHFKENLQLESLAKALGYDPSYLSRYISANMKTNFHQYLTSFRLSYAIELLLQTDKQIGTIAFQSGFPSIRTFNNAFKKIYNMTPTEYKKMKKIDNNDYLAKKRLN